MLALAMVLFTALVLVLPAARALHRATRRIEGPARGWTRTAAYLLLAAGEMYLFGLVHMQAYWGASPRDACVSRYDNWDGMHGHARYWPLERKCTEYVDMVPAYVNPLIILLLTGALSCALIGAVQLVRRRRRGSPTSL
ncbi:hypothetical protein MRQ36_16955 [Micromonospora sp. R77]|uniref:hypothetical protein n=1 Tax=Micromonospora sp. R77 TaxID=2925836 RepID=UPI001F613D5F|nr:hypothetical protein [Micromonospora sp. R77]MCI4064196.1 hypothetical protein [Micromonospora sp. R77]